MWHAVFSVSESILSFNISKSVSENDVCMQDGVLQLEKLMIRIMIVIVSVIVVVILVVK